MTSINSMPSLNVLFDFFPIAKYMFDYTGLGFNWPINNKYYMTQNNI